MQPHDGRPEEQVEPGSPAPRDDAATAQPGGWSTPTHSDPPSGPPSGPPADGRYQAGQGAQAAAPEAAPGQGAGTPDWQSRLSSGPGEQGGGYATPPPPAQGQPGPGEQSYGQPGAEQPTQVYGQQPDYGRPGPSAPASGHGAQPTQAFGTPAYGQPSYGEPVHGRSGYGEPTHGEPTYGDRGTYAPPGQGSGYGTQPTTSYGTDQYGQTAYGQTAYGQPAYGQPGTDGYGPAQGGYGGYGQPGQGGTPTPAKKGHLGRWLAVAGAVVVVGVVAILLFVAPGFVVSKVLDPSAVARTITSQSANGNGDYTDVNCPSNEKVDSGNTFTCTAADNKQITVKITSGDGDYTWEPAN